MSNQTVWTGGMRREYGIKRLSRKDLNPDPILQFGEWFEEGKSTVLEPNAMALSTADAQGRPSSRMVLMKAFDHHGIVFATSYLSQKSHELDENPHAALLFYWPSLERQLRVTGQMKRTTDEESDEIFQSRSPKSQMAARASSQSSPIENRELLEAAFFAQEKVWTGKKVERPEFWGGYRLEPNGFEFWQGGEHRMHDRFVYLGSGFDWSIQRLQP